MSSHSFKDEKVRAFDEHTYLETLDYTIDKEQLSSNTDGLCVYNMSNHVRRINHMNNTKKLITKYVVIILRVSQLPLFVINAHNNPVIR
ncbi:hypothetical protein CU097_011176 [Rhizopus azygosporus]|uniref:Uncharacterized protein n=1 Tax=Rhizopus azygosporus TaxID=86630 RepID=A0A367K7I1_RHIAZ|nr:hypothetical protein CU097_011176 [Rhizopus azygosporus]